MKLLGRKGPKPYQTTARYNKLVVYLSVATKTVPIPRLGNILNFGLWALFFLVITGPTYLLSFRHPLLAAANLVLLAVAVIGVALAGDNGRRFVGFLGLRALAFRKEGVQADRTPISRVATRVLTYGFFALEVAFGIWWLVFTRVPLPAAANFTDPLFYEEALKLHILTQLYDYLWLLPILWVISLGFVKSLDYLPIVGLVMRRTRILPIFIVPILAILEARTALLFLGTYWS